MRILRTLFLFALFLFTSYGATGGEIPTPTLEDRIQAVRKDFSEREAILNSWADGFLEFAKKSEDPRMKRMAESLRKATFITYGGRGTFVSLRKPNGKSRPNKDLFFGVVKKSDPEDLKELFGFGERKILDITDLGNGVVLTVFEDQKLSPFWRGLVIASGINAATEVAQTSTGRVDTREFDRVRQRAFIASFKTEDAVLGRVGGWKYQDFLSSIRSKYGERVSCDSGMRSQIELLEADWKPLDEIFGAPQSNWEREFRANRIFIHLLFESCRKEGFEEKFFEWMFGKKVAA